MGDKFQCILGVSSITKIPATQVRTFPGRLKQLHLDRFTLSLDFRRIKRITPVQTQRNSTTAPFEIVSEFRCFPVRGLERGLREREIRHSV